MSKTEKQETGDLGENLVEMFLKKHFFTIIDRNYRKPWGEIDIVARKGDDWRFVEVKTVRRNHFSDDDLSADEASYEPSDNMHPWKLKRLGRAIQTYLLEKKIDEDKIEWQLDLISVYLNEAGETLKIDWLEDVF